MNVRRSIAWISALLLCISATAHAGQYGATDLGNAVPMWMETLADINDSGDAAWTSWSGASGQNMPAGATGAQYYLEGVGVGPAALPGTSAASWAVGVTKRVTDGSHNVIGVAGSDASSQRMTDRSALLWSVRVGANPSILTTDLGARTKYENDASKTVQQSAAYGVVARTGSANTYYVGGFARDRVARSVLPRPVVWAVGDAHGANPTVTAHRLKSLGGNLGNGNGYVSSVAQNGSSYWACGNSAPSDPALYVQATCWNMGSGPSTNPTPVATLNTALSQKYGSGISTSMVHRLRVLPIGSNGAQHAVAIGSALVNGKWVGWAFDLDAGTNDVKLWDNLNVVNNAESLAYDAAAIEYAEEGGGTPSYGLMMGGVSRSAASAPDILGGGPVSVTTSALRGVERRMLLTGTAGARTTSDAGQVCVINDDSAVQSAQYEQLLALSSDGAYRLAMAGGKLLRLSEVDDSGVTVHVNQRRYQIKESTRSAPVVKEHFFAFANRNVHEAVLRLSDELGCDAPSFANGACNPSDPVAFDIGNNNKVDIALTNANNALRSQKEPGTFPTSYDFAQLALRSGSDCTITPVKATVTSTLNPQKDHEDDTTPWGQCGSISGYDTDTSSDVRHCGSCNNNVQSLTCADNVCASGTPAIGTVDNNKCAIGASNAWSCFDDSVFEQIPVNYDATKFQDNRCKACDSSANQTDWTVKNLSDEYYQCIAHHWNTRFGVPGKPVWAFFTDSGEGSAGDANFKLRDYWTNHLCTYAVGQNNDPETRNVSNSNMWERKATPGKGTTYTWPSSFQGMQSRHNHSTEFTNTSETRHWLFQRRLRYLGQMNGGSWSNDGRNYYMGWGATTFYLKPGQEEWFLFYYSDPQNWQDRIGALVQFDGTQMDLDVDLHFACARDGRNHHPRMDGFMDCGAEGHGNHGDKRNAFGVTCGPVTGSGYDRSSYCKANTWQSYNNLPWTFSGGDSWDGRVPSDWGNRQGGIYVEGHVDCGALPHRNSSGRDGWVFVKVKRRDTNASTCTPITLRSTWFHHNRKVGFTNCWN